jgi:uncharacterized membrane protein YdfJ with MMPL/SSD domain
LVLLPHGSAAIRLPLLGAGLGTAWSGGILIVLVLGASTDYALLLVARYREELRRHADRHEAMAIALRRAGPAIIASAATVIAGMLCLLVAESADTSGLGRVAAIGIFLGLLAMITLLPALLVICGRWVFWPVRPRFGTDEPTAHGVWARVGRMIARHPRRVWVVTALLLALAGTFVMLGTLPLVILTEIGFCVAAGVLLDTIIVRSVLVTALSLDLGRHMWWPSRLARQSVPEVSAEAEPAATSPAS